MPIQSPAAPDVQAISQRRFPIGAEVLSEGGVHFRVWAPSRSRVEVMLGQDAHALTREESGHFSGLVPQARAGMRYKFRLDGGDWFPDPVSRYQPEGPHEASEIVDPHAFSWTDQHWQGLPLQGQVIYEMHIGTFTPEGTWQAAIQHLPALKDTGITTLEVMPVSEFPGRFGWGYDGVDMFAPSHLYGTPDDMRQFVDAAHALGLAVILDVVYNHFGPDGNYTAQYTRDYFTDKHSTDWGEAINYDGDNCQGVREFVCANAAYWIQEFHLDGLRLDATQDIHDDSQPHILADISTAVRSAAQGRATLMVGENEPQEVQLVVPTNQGGYGLDALWNDDFHHAAMVRLTGRHEAYYTDYRGTPQEFISAAKYGYLYQGQWYRWQKARRGTSGLAFDPAAFCIFIQNHDQIANSARGLRAHQLTAPGLYRAMTALTLLSPGTPMLFQGQEFCASTPFLYFADHKPELAEMVRKGRRTFMAQFRSMQMPEMEVVLDPPHDLRTFEKSKLDHCERETHAEAYALHRDLLQLRREDPTFRKQQRRGVDGAVLSADAFLLRYWGEEPGSAEDRLLVVNFGLDLRFDPAPEPLLAPPQGLRWEMLWSSEHPRYGGIGVAPLNTVDNWLIPGFSATVLHAKPWGDEDESAGELTGADETAPSARKRHTRRKKENKGA